MTSQYLGSQRKLIELPRKLLVLHTCLPRNDDIFGWLSLYHEIMDQFIIMPILKENKLNILTKNLRMGLITNKINCFS